MTMFLHYMVREALRAAEENGYGEELALMTDQELAIDLIERDANFEGLDILLVQTVVGDVRRANTAY